MRSAQALLACALVCLAPSAVRAEVSELRIPLGAGGFGFLPLNMMQKYGLIEKYAAEAGVPVKVNWSNLGGSAVMNDALLSGAAHFATGGPPGFLVLWDRTRSNAGVKAVAAVSSIPMMLNTRISQLASLDAVTANQKIAVTSVRISIPSIIMQMYALKKFGQAQTFRFDPFTVTMAHPDAVVAMLSGSGNIVGHWASAPFAQREIKDPAVRTIMNSDEVMGGSTTFTLMFTTTKFHDENPKLYAAVLKALRRAQQMISEDRKNATAVLLDSMGGKGWTQEELLAILNDPTTKYLSQPEHVIEYANFMHATGTLKNVPAAPADLFFSPPPGAGTP